VNENARFSLSTCSGSILPSLNRRLIGSPIRPVVPSGYITAIAATAPRSTIKPVSAITTKPVSTRSIAKPFISLWSIMAHIRDQGLFVSRHIGKVLNECDIFQMEFPASNRVRSVDRPWPGAVLFLRLSMGKTSPCSSLSNRLSTSR
jgi:hypothetical protein